MPELITEGDWQFLSMYAGEAPCGHPEWAWSAFGYLKGALKVGTSGPTRKEALAKARKMAFTPEAKR
jgi:hypothetical protein